MVFVNLFWECSKNTVGEGLDPPGGKGCDILSISAKTNRVHGRVKTLPYRNNETCAKLSNTNLSFPPQPVFHHREAIPYLFPIIYYLLSSPSLSPDFLFFGHFPLDEWGKLWYDMVNN